MDFIIYTSEGSETGPRLASFLGIEHGTSMPDQRYDHLIRWGSARRVPYIPSNFTVNTRTALCRSTNKLKSLKHMDDAGVPVPPFSERWRDLNLPVLGRNTSHMAGRDIHLVLQPKDIPGDADFYTEYIPKQYEFRVHVFKGQIFKISQKKRMDEPEYDPVCWNYDSGWRFLNPDIEPHGLQQAIPAVTSHKLDFGAVDIMITPDGDPYVLEVNTAPGCCPSTLEMYGEQIANAIGLENYPGMEAVEWEEDDGI